MADDKYNSKVKTGGNSIPGGGRVRELFRKYGKVALGVHLVVYATFLGGTRLGALDQGLYALNACANKLLFPVACFVAYLRTAMGVG